MWNPEIWREIFFCVSYVQEMNYFPVGGIEKRHAVAVPVAGAVECAARVTFGLFKHILRTDGDFLCFDDAQEFPFDEEA